MLPAIDLYWLPLGAGGRFVRLNGRAYEALASRHAHRPALALYHSALIVADGTEAFAIEMGPTTGQHDPGRGAVAGGVVGSPRLRWLPLFRYEVRRWPGGRIPDVDEAVDSPVRLTIDAAIARRLLGLVPAVPTPTWGRDELATGDMWNSNSLVAWLLARTGVDASAIRPPTGGRAPGWDAGLVVAARQLASHGRPGPEGQTSTRG